MMYPKLAWLELLKQTGAIDDYTIHSYEDKEGVVTAEVAIKLLDVENKVEFRSDKDSSKLSIPMDQFLQQLDEDQGLR